MMNRARGALAAALLFTSACGTTSVSLPTPEILSVVPNAMRSSERSDITIAFEAVYTMHVDYGREQVSTVAPSGVRVWIGEREATVSSFDPEGVVVVSVPRELPPGEYAVRIVLEDGREARATQHLEIQADVVPDPEDDDPTHGGPKNGDGGTFASDAGVVRCGMEDGGGGKDPTLEEPGPDDPMREGDVTGFVFDDIDDTQHVNESFVVTVRAEGPRAAHFVGPLKLDITRGSVSPQDFSSCVKGVCTQRIRVEANGGNVRLVVSDTLGARGTSPRFHVKKK